MRNLCWENEPPLAVRTGLSFVLLLAIVACSSSDRVFTDEDFQLMTQVEWVSYLHDDYDCGEWGGHRETILISRNGETYEVTIKRDSSDCFSPKLNRKDAGDSAATKTFIVGAEKKASIIRVVNALSYNKSKDSKWMMSNASNQYIMKFQTPNRKLTVEAYFSDESLAQYAAFKKELLRMR